MTDLLDIIVHEFPNPVEIEHIHGTHPQTGAAEKREANDAAPLAVLVFKTIADPFLGTLNYFRVLSGVLKGGTTVLNTTRGKEERIGQLSYARGKGQEPTPEVHAGDIGVTAKLADTHTGDTLCDPANPILLDAIESGEPIFEQAVVAKTKVDEDKMGPALQRVAASDPAFRFRRDPETGQTILCGAGETHLAIVIERLKKFGANLEIVDRKIPFRETVTQKAEAQGRHKKQTGGRGQFGDCWLRVEPNRGGGFEFRRCHRGRLGAAPVPSRHREGRPAGDGFRRSAGHPVVDVRVTCYNGSYHDVDSSEAAFIMAGIAGFHMPRPKRPRRPCWNRS